MELWVKIVLLCFPLKNVCCWICSFFPNVSVTCNIGEREREKKLYFFCGVRKKLKHKKSNEKHATLTWITASHFWSDILWSEVWPIQPSTSGVTLSKHVLVRAPHTHTHRRIDGAGPWFKTAGMPELNQLFTRAKSFAQLQTVLDLFTTEQCFCWQIALKIVIVVTSSLPQFRTVIKK